MARLTALEIDAILAVAGNADPGATFEDCCDDDDPPISVMMKAYDRGIEKLTAMLAERRRRPTAKGRPRP